MEVGGRSTMLRRLAAAHNTGSMTTLLCELCADTTQLSGAEITLASAGDLYGSLCHSDDISASLGELQYELGEGPAVDAVRLGRSVLEPDLADPVTVRWVAFSGPATQAGARAVFSFPLQLGSARLGALNLYRGRPGPLLVEQHAHALFMAQVATEAVLAVQAGAEPGRLACELEVGAHFHYAVQQAAGMVAVQLGVTIADALIRVRAFAFGSGRPLADVAREIVERRLHFDVRDDHDG